MANRAQRLSTNAKGDFFVDSTCIDCDQCREIAPEVFGDGEGHASVLRQPDSGAALHNALRALVTCPVGAIGTEQRHALAPVVAGFPEPIAEDVYFCGFASPDSFGASSYLIVRPEGNVLVDSPRFAARLVRGMEGLGGVRWMFLSHVDDMADHAKFRRHFGCERIIHRQEVRAATGLEQVPAQAAGRPVAGPFKNDVELEVPVLPAFERRRGDGVRVCDGAELRVARQVEIGHVATLTVRSDLLLCEPAALAAQGDVLAGLVVGESIAVLWCEDEGRENGRELLPASDRSHLEISH